MKTSQLTKRALAAIAGGTLLVGAAAVPAQAWSSSSTVRISGVTYTAKASSCNFYMFSCSWKAEAKLSSSKSFTHYGYVRSTGISAKLSISANAGVSISGNQTKLATVKKPVVGRANTISGVAKPSALSVKVGAKSRIVRSGVDVSSGWSL